MKDDLKLRELKAKDCMIDASKLAEELHGEQEQAGVLENERKLLESKLKEIQVIIIAISKLPFNFVVLGKN